MTPTSPALILIVDLCWKKDSLSNEEYVRPIQRIAKEHAPVKMVHFLEVTPDDVNDCTAVILCGTALADNTFADHLDAFDWLKEFKKPVLGICAGMQVLGAMHNGHIMSVKEIGMTRITLFREDPLFVHSLETLPVQAGLGHSLDVYSLHNHCLAASLPEFDVLARSNLCVQAIKHKTLPQYGILFHPEVRNEHVVRNFLSGIK